MSAICAAKRGQEKPRARARPAVRRAIHRVGSSRRSSSSAAHGADPGADLADRTVLDCRASDFPQHPQVAGDDRRAAGHRLEQRQAKSLALGRQQDQRGSPIHRRERPLVDETDDRHVVGQAEIAESSAAGRR